jgi:surface antigen
MPSQEDYVEKGSGLIPIPKMRPAEPVASPLPAGEQPAPPGSVQQTPAPRQFGPLLSAKTGQWSVPNASPAEPVSRPATSALPATTRELPNPYITRVLSATLPREPENATQRVPVVIKASMKRPAPAPPPLPPEQHKKRRLKVTLLGLLMLVLIAGLAFFSVTPLGRDIGFNPLSLPEGSLLTGQQPGLSSLVAQATATAVYHHRTDGYDPSYFGSQLLGNGSASLAWPLGQCTYWANYEYHRLTGHWVSWNGNADQWVAGARQAGWNISQTPHVPSILVMMPYTQSASGYGHVAVVEGVSGNIVHTSNMNWYANGGGWNRVSNVDFRTGQGMYFVWHS